MTTVVLLTVLVAITVLVGIVFSSASADRELKLVRSSKDITKGYIEISTAGGRVRFPLKEPLVLDSLSKALRTSVETHVPTGGAYTLWADVRIDKEADSVVLRVHFSPYYGKYFLVGNRTFDCPYLTNLVERYGQQARH